MEVDGSPHERAGTGRGVACHPALLILVASMLVTGSRQGIWVVLSRGNCRWGPGNRDDLGAEDAGEAGQPRADHRRSTEHLSLEGEQEEAGPATEPGNQGHWTAAENLEKA